MTKFSEPLNEYERARLASLIAIGLRPIFFPRSAYTPLKGRDDKEHLCRKAAAAALAVFEAERPALKPEDEWEGAEPKKWDEDAPLLPDPLPPWNSLP